MPVTRTLNPLPFHDLEPRRFEDLVRQLAYDFRPWLRLEATGRAGSDDGFDVRGIERGDATNEQIDEAADSENGEQSEIDEIVQELNEKTWLIQCKRERKIGPTQLDKYLEAVSVDERKTLYGIIFVACCDFSKRSRDVMADWCRSNNIAEFQIWSVSDIETMLMQPKNDHILFAFFGISLQIRKRSIASQIKSRIVMKRKVERVLKRSLHAPFLLRSPDSENFPYSEKGEKPQWVVRDNRNYDHRGVGFQAKDYFAYVNDKGEWDMANGYNRAIPEHDNPWVEFEDRFPSSEDRAELFKFYSEIEQSHQARISVVAFIPFEEIIAIDEIGDDVFGEGGRGRPTLYVEFSEGVFASHPFRDISMSRGSTTVLDFDESRRIKYFPDKFRRDGLN